jgi:uncharacterized Fe-S cluster protein YjdI
MKTYQKEDVDIVWDAEKCTHAGFCARQLSEVFKPRERPWIQPKNANKQEIIDQVAKCPSGALSIKKRHK